MRTPPNVNNRSNKPGIKRDSIEAEKKVAEYIVRLQPASGATPGKPGDITFSHGVHDFLIDSKSTETGRIGVTTSMLQKIKSEAASQNKIPSLLLDYVNSPESIRYWAVIPLHILCKLLDEVHKKEE